MKKSAVLATFCIVLWIPIAKPEERSWGDTIIKSMELRSQNRLPEAISLLTEAWTRAERTRVVPQWRAALCHQLGANYLKMADLASAERFFERALTI